MAKGFAIEIYFTKTVPGNGPKSAWYPPTQLDFNDFQNHEQ